MEKKFNYKRIITIVLVLIVWTTILLLFVDTKPLYGKWNCGSDIVIEFSRTRSFEIYNTSNKEETYIEGTYKAERQKVALPKIKYEVSLESDEEIDSDYKKDFLISFNQTKLSEMTILDKSDNSKYTCKKAK